MWILSLPPRTAVIAWFIFMLVMVGVLIVLEWIEKDPHNEKSDRKMIRGGRILIAGISTIQTVLMLIVVAMNGPG